jgi:hypothetical protein
LSAKEFRGDARMNRNGRIRLGRSDWILAGGPPGIAKGHNN